MPRWQITVPGIDEVSDQEAATKDDAIAQFVRAFGHQSRDACEAQLGAIDAYEINEKHEAAARAWSEGLPTPGPGWWVVSRSPLSNSKSRIRRWGPFTTPEKAEELVIELAKAGNVRAAQIEPEPKP